jgi:hypothetical protein
MDIAGATKFQVSRREVMPLSVKERILAIRLMDKVNANPAAAEKLGIVIEKIPAVKEIPFPNG